MATTPIEEVYPRLFRDDGDRATHYAPLIFSMGYEVALRLEGGYYLQREVYILFRDGERYGIVSFSWGPCSVWVDLQGCASYAELNALRQRIHDAIRWGTRKDTLFYLRTRGWRGGAGTDKELQRLFVRFVKLYFTGT